MSTKNNNDIAKDILFRFQQNDESAIDAILAFKGPDSERSRLLKAITRTSSITTIKTLLSHSDAKTTQTILEAAASEASLAPIVRYILSHHPPPFLGEKVRCMAIFGSVPVWRHLIAFDASCVNVEVGHQGDALGLAVDNDDVELVSFLLEEGKANVHRSHFLGVPVLTFAERYGKKGEIVDLLVSHGAQVKDVID